MTGQNGYLLRPASDARRVVQILPDETYRLASFGDYGRRYIGSRMSFEEVEMFLARRSGNNGSGTGEQSSQVKFIQTVFSGDI